MYLKEYICRLLLWNLEYRYVFGWNFVRYSSLVAINLFAITLFKDKLVDLLKFIHKIYTIFGS